MIQLELILNQLSQAIACFDRLYKKSGGYLNTLHESDLFELHTTLAAAAEDLAPPGSTYRRNVEKALSKIPLYDQTAMLAGVVRALHAAYLSGFMGSFAHLVRADLFNDFIEMAEHLLNQGYKDPAAVLAGGVLEEHLRKLCERIGVDIMVGDKPKPASRMNEELVALDGYGKLDAKNVTAWLGLRNSAAHGKYSDYTSDQVRLMLLGVRGLAAKTGSTVAG